MPGFFQRFCQGVGHIDGHVEVMFVVLLVRPHVLPGQLCIATEALVFARDHKVATLFIVIFELFSFHFIIAAVVWTGDDFLRTLLVVVIFSVIFKSAVFADAFPIRAFILKMLLEVSLLVKLWISHSSPHLLGQGMIVSSQVAVCSSSVLTVPTQSHPHLCQHYYISREGFRSLFFLWYKRTEPIMIYYVCFL